MLRAVANADVLIAMVVGAGEAQDRMRGRAPIELKGRKVKLAARGGPGFTAMTPERRREVARMGGLASSNVSPEERERRAQAAQARAEKRERMKRCHEEIMRLHAAGLRPSEISRELNVSMGTVGGVLHRRGVTITRASARTRFNLSAAEFHEYGRLRASCGYSAEEAAGIIIRSRRGPSANSPPGAA